MPRFFVAADQLSGGRAAVLGPDADHLSRSLRARPGERVVVVDDTGHEHGVRLTEVAPGRVAGEVEWSRPATGEPRLGVEVIQAVAREGMDGAVEALVAAGAAGIHPCITERTVARPELARAARRLERWAAIARESAQLAGRGAVPPVHPVRSLAEVLAALPDGVRVLACVVDPPAVPLSRVRLELDRRVALCIGPEGGFGPQDRVLLDRWGAEPVHLGPRVLRSRLAGGLAVSVLLALSGDLDVPAVGNPAEAR